MRANSKESLGVGENSRDSTELLHTLAEDLPGFVACVNADTLKYEFVNSSYQKSFGVPINKIIGSHIKNIVGELAYKNALKYIEEVRKGKSVSYENTFDMKNGKRWIKANYAPGFDKTGKVTSIIVMSYDITEQKKAEEELKKSEDKYRFLVERMQEICVIVNKTGKISFMNSFGLKTLGYTEKELLGKSIFSILTARTVKKAMQSLTQEFLGKTQKEMEVEIKTKKGDIRTILLYEESNPIYKNGKMTELLIYGIDITERKKAHEDLYQQKIAMESAIDGIAILNEKGEYKYMNKSHAKIYGYNTAEELIGKTWRRLYTPDELRRFDKEIMPELNKKRNWQGEATGKKADGETFRQELSLTMIDDSGIICVVRDISKRKKTEEEISNSKKLLQRIIDLLPVRIFWKDRDLKYIGCNEIFAKDAGKNKSEELVGKDDFQMGWKEQAKTYRDDDKKTIESGKSKLNFEEQQTTPKGDKIWLKTSKIPLTDLQGKVIGILGTYEDITSSKKAEEELKKSKERLLETQRMVQLGYWDWDIKTGNVKWSEEVFKTFRLDPKKFFPQIDSIMALSPWPGHHERNKELIQRAAENREDGSYEQKFLRPDKSIGYYYSTFRGKYDEKGHLTSIIGTVMDITERKKAEETLKSKTALLEAQINSNMDGILIVDTKGNKLLQNQRCIDLWRIPKDIAALNDDSKQIEFVKNRTKDPKKFVEKVVYLYAHPTETSSDEVEFKDGMILERYSAPVLGKDGQNYGRIWIFHDVTEQKKAEEELKTSKRILQEKISNLETFQKVVINRELRMVELKDKIKELEEKLIKK